MTNCRKCGGRKRRWPRSCPHCRHGVDRAETAVDAGELALETGLFRLIGRGMAGMARLLLRAFD
ncbi:hypothetical protein EAO76_10470 [Streptomyces sp. sk2.1]|nr:hypothetical protein EAO76_10470 [Streptomyces sp. sk2.1]